MLVRNLAFATAVLAAPGLASADLYADADAGFATLDRTGDGTGGGAELSYIIMDDELGDLVDVTFMRLDLHGQYMSPGGAGAYVDVPVGLAFSDADDVTALGNIEAAGVFRLYGPGGLDWVFRGGVLLPTASDDIEEVSTNLINTVGARLTDFTTVIPDTTWLRLSASPIFYDGALFVRADAGVDLPIDEPDGAEYDPIARLNVGVGAHLGPQFTITGELVNSVNLDDDDEDDFVHAAAVSARFATGSVEPFAAIVVPFDDGEEYDLWAITAGISGGL